MFRGVNMDYTPGTLTRRLKEKRKNKMRELRYRALENLEKYHPDNISSEPDDDPYFRIVQEKKPRRFGLGEKTIYRIEEVPTKKKLGKGVGICLSRGASGKHDVGYEITLDIQGKLPWDATFVFDRNIKPGTYEIKVEGDKLTVEKKTPWTKYLGLGIVGAAVVGMSGASYYFGHLSGKEQGKELGIKFVDKEQIFVEELAEKYHIDPEELGELVIAYKNGDLEKIEKELLEYEKLLGDANKLIEDIQKLLLESYEHNNTLDKTLKKYDANTLKWLGLTQGDLEKLEAELDNNHSFIALENGTDVLVYDRGATPENISKILGILSDGEKVSDFEKSKFGEIFAINAELKIIRETDDYVVYALSPGTDDVWPEFKGEKKYLELSDESFLAKIWNGFVNYFSLNKQDKRSTELLVGELGDAKNLRYDIYPLPCETICGNGEEFELIYDTGKTVAKVVELPACGGSCTPWVIVSNSCYGIQDGIEYLIEYLKCKEKKKPKSGVLGGEEGGDDIDGE